METNHQFQFYQEIADQAAIELDEELTAAAYPEETQPRVENSVYNFNEILDSLLEDE